MFFSYLKADFLKTKHLSVRMAHLLISIVTPLIFIAYDSYAPWDDYVKIDLYYQVIGMALPFLIGLFCAILSEQEQSAGCFQMMLMSPKKVVPFLSKLLLLLMFCAGALLVASLLFGVAFRFGLHGKVVDLAFYPMAALVMFVSSIPLYLLHLYLSFDSNKGVSIALGIVESVLSALFLTGLGESVWKYVPLVWPARAVATFFAAYNGEMTACVELKQVAYIGFFVITIGTIIYLFWACRWEGSRIAD